MKNLLKMNDEEKNRILNLHESATKKQYITESSNRYVDEAQALLGVTVDGHFGPKSLEALKAKLGVVSPNANTQTANTQTANTQTANTQTVNTQTANTQTEPSTKPANQIPTEDL
jgi:hypothetical protein